MDITTIVIDNARKVAEISLDHGEEVAIETFDEGEVWPLIRDGRVDHALSVLGLYAWLWSRSAGDFAGSADRSLDPLPLLYFGE